MMVIFSYEVGNKGTGPAIIKYARLTFENELIQSWPQYLQLRNGRSVEHSQSHISSIVLSAGESKKPLQLKDAEAAKVLVNTDNLQIELCYCSIYDECWLVDRYNDPKPIAQCSIDDSQRFLQ
ncbi:hypothetical protein [Rheinheimera sp.]|uniref:hypothetical protein n=1 Tax=Rheinheimera sp. TaxID=1869214 RepID=UPI004048DFEA